MTFEPRYGFPIGSELKLMQRRVVVNGQNEHGYEMVGCDDGATTLLPFGTLVDQLKLPGASINTALPTTGARHKHRLGGHTTAHSLPNHQVETAKFNSALCEAVRTYSKWHGQEIGDPDFVPTIRHLDRAEVRNAVARLAAPLFGKKILTEPPRGGNPKDLWVIYKGRTLLKYYLEYLDLEPGEPPLDALAPLHHLKGNYTPKFCNRLRQMMTHAWEKVGLDLRAPTVEAVRKLLATEIGKENEMRGRNKLPALVVPSRKSLRRHRDALVSPVEYLIATTGLRRAKLKRGQGSTDYRALLIGEMVEIDECKISLVTSAKVRGMWEGLSEGGKAYLEKLDEYIKSRFWLLVMLDVATRMPLAWVIAENPCADATLALFRMATRDKTREKLMYGCTGQPAAAVGLLHVKNDNGPGLRNSTTVAALMGIGSANTITRTYSPGERPHIERFFGTIEVDVLNLLPGYTGGKAGDLPGYDALRNGVMSVEYLHEILTRYFIDEYPSTRHHGVAMCGRRPFDVYKEINETRGQIPPIDPQLRRISLGWEQSVTPNDEGVRVFGGIWFNSSELQKQRDKYHVTGKVKVFVDPDNMNFATVVLPRVKDPIEVRLQITAFADMTLPEILLLMKQHRKKDLTTAEFHEDQILRTRLDRYNKIKAIGVEHNLPRSYSTVEECRVMAKAVFSGARVIRPEPFDDTASPGKVADLELTHGVYALGEEEVQPEEPVAKIDNPNDRIPETERTSAPRAQEAASNGPDVKGKAGRKRQTDKSDALSQALPLPKTLKELK